MQRVSHIYQTHLIGIKRHSWARLRPALAFGGRLSLMANKMKVCEAIEIISKTDIAEPVIIDLIKKTRLGSHFSELDLIKIETNELFLQLEQLNK